MRTTTRIEDVAHRTAWRLGAAAWCAAGLFGGSIAPAQEEFAGGDEVVVLSPFEVSAGEDRGYAAADTLAGTRLRTNLRDVGSSISAVSAQFLRETGGFPTVPITLVRRADAVVIEFALSNSADKQDARNKELTESVELIAAAIKAAPGLRFENREVQLATGNRARSIIGKGGVVTSFANFAVFAEFSPEARLYERVKQVRGLVSAAKLAGGTKVMDGPVALWVKRPAAARAELLGKIFEDLDAVRKGVGADAELLVSGLAGPVRVRACSEAEVELWIDYGFTIRSVRELEAKRPERKG